MEAALQSLGEVCNELGVQMSTSGKVIAKLGDVMALLAKGNPDAAKLLSGSSGAVDGKKKKRQQVHIEGAPKRPANAYILWSEDQRAKSPDAKIDAKVLGEQWKTVADNLKKKYEDKAKAAREAYHAEIVKICGERGIPVPGEKTGKKRDASGAIKAPAGGKAAAAKAAADSDSDSTSSDDEAPKPPAAKKQIPAAGTSASSSSSASSKKKPAPPADSDSDSSDSSVDVKPAKKHKHKKDKK